MKNEVIFKSPVGMADDNPTFVELAESWNAYNRLLALSKTDESVIFWSEPLWQVRFAKMWLDRSARIRIMVFSIDHNTGQLVTKSIYEGTQAQVTIGWREQRCIGIVTDYLTEGAVLVGKVFVVFPPKGDFWAKLAELAMR